MIMMGMKFMNDVPFRELYIHALVRDAEKQKMSKTKGNVIDPLEVTEKYGTDAVRFALAISAAPGTDIAFSEEKIESYRAFANKIWNAGRFILMNLQKLPEAWHDQLTEALRPVPELAFTAVTSLESLALADRWVFSRLQAVSRKVDEALAGYRFHEAAYEVYHFFWHEICDWYLEWVKPEITRSPTARKFHRPGSTWRACLNPRSTCSIPSCRSLLKNFGSGFRTSGARRPYPCWVSSWSASVPRTRSRRGNSS